MKNTISFHLVLDSKYFQNAEVFHVVAENC